MAKITNNPDEWVHADEAAQIMRVSKKVLSNYSSPKNGRIPLKAIRKGVNAKFYHKPTLMGLN